MPHLYSLICVSIIFCSDFFARGAATKEPRLLSWKMTYEQPSTLPLLHLTDETFAVPEDNALYMRSIALGEYAYSNQEHACIATHPDFLTNPATPHASAVPEAGPAEHPFHIVMPNIALAAATTSRKSSYPSSSALPRTSHIALPTSTRHTSSIVSCSKQNDIIATASAWHILLTNMASKETTVIEHDKPLVFSLQDKKCTLHESGKYGSNNFICCVAIAERLFTGHFDGSIIVRDAATTKAMHIVPPLSEEWYTKAQAIKGIVTTTDTDTYALSDHTLQHLDLKQRSRVLQASQSSGRFSSIYSDEKGTLFLGTQKGTLYIFEPRTEMLRSPFSTKLSASCSEDGITALAASKSLIYIGTESGKIYTYNTDSGTYCSFTTDNTTAITSILPEEHCLIFSTSGGTVRCLRLK